MDSNWLARPGGVSASVSLVVAVLIMATTAGARASAAPTPSSELCPRPAAGSEIAEPHDLRSEHGILAIELTVHDSRQADGSVRYRYQASDGSYSPTLRVHPGDLLLLKLKNDLRDVDPSSLQTHLHHHAALKPSQGQPDPCTSGIMSVDFDQPAFSWYDIAARLPSGRSTQDFHPAGDGRLRIPDQNPRGRASRAVLVSPAHTRVQQGASVGRALPAHSSSRVWNGPTWSLPGCRNACSSCATKIYSIRTRRRQNRNPLSRR